MKFEALKPTTADEATSMPEAERQEKIALLEELEQAVTAIETNREELQKAMISAEESNDWSDVKLVKESLKKLLSMAKSTQRKLEGKGEELTVSADYKYKDEGGKEISETIELDFETEISSAISLYEKHDIEIPVDFREQMQAVWEENIDSILEAIREEGFDKVLFIPDSLPSLKELDVKMTAGYKESFKKENPGEDGAETYWGTNVDSITETARAGARIVLVHQAPDLTAQPELKKTLGKKYGGEKEDGKDNHAQDFLDAGEAMTATEYFILQRDIFEKTGVHIDSKKTPDGSYIYWTWLPGSRVGSRVVRAYFHPGVGQVCVYASDPDDTPSDIGGRPSRCFYKK